MGMFDYVKISCPYCKEIIEDQTKDFWCTLSTIDLDEEQPLYIASSFFGEWTCDSCACEFSYGAEIPQVVKPEKKIITLGKKKGD